MVQRDPYSLVGKRVWVAGHQGMVGAAIIRRLAGEHCALLTVTRGEVDLRRQSKVDAWVEANRPQAIFVAAATVGGILANDTRPSDFLYDNLTIATNIIAAAHRCGVEKLMFLGSSCVYPRLAAQPIAESAMLSGPLEPTNEWYAVAKIAGVKLCQAYRRQHGCDFISVLPTNLYGPGDTYDLRESHVIPALIQKAHDAKCQGSPSLTIWGSGTPRREFLHVDDCADGLVRLMRDYSEEEHVNLGSGDDLTIAELAEAVAEVVGFTGEIIYDHTKPDGMPRKLMRADKMRALGWTPRIGLRDGLRDAYAWFVAHVAAAA